MRLESTKLLALASLALLCSCSAMKVEYDSNAIIINGQRKVINAGAIHYPRSTPEMWPDLIRKAKEGGLDAIDTYIFWDIHEPQRRKYDFSGNKDFVKFFKLVQQAGLYGVIRIGPYVCAEWNFGGFPMWLHNTPGIELRTDNEIYKNEMQTFTSKIVNMCKEAKLFASQGGPIIFAQIENEYGNIMSAYGEAGKSYLQWVAKMAVAQNIGVPWFMCQQTDAPAPMINTCNGHYCDTFKQNNPKSPKMWTENWSGWFKLWGNSEPYRPAEDLAFAVARFFQSGGVFNCYYMYHGGTNFGRTSGGPYITTSYDYDAPLDEFGNMNQPKWGHLKKLHEALKKGEKVLTNGIAMTKNIQTNVDLTTYMNNATGESFCFLSNQDGSKDANVDLGQNGKFYVPAWSVSLLLGCKNEIYNTAKVTTQTLVMTKKAPKDQIQDHISDNVQEGEAAQLAEQAQSAKLSWVWLPEVMKDALQGVGQFKADQLLDQKEASGDVTDYFWYITSVDINGTKPKINAVLNVSTNGHGLHAFINKKHIGFQFAGSANGEQSFNGDDYSFQFQKNITLKRGMNIISLLSATVGLPNYGARYDMKPTGLFGKQVELALPEDTINLTSNQWFYKVGLDGEAKHLYDPTVPHGNKWSAKKLPKNRPFTWYKTTFKAPSDTEPLVIKLESMGKGHAWVNGQSIGRFWPKQVAGTDGCNEACDYRGGYKPDKCRRNCGEPSQKWYHIPRSFINNGTNTLILFEEQGGDPTQVTFNVLTVGVVCGQTEEGSVLDLSCQGGGRAISDVQFASFGDPKGTCGSFQKGTFEATQSRAVVEKACVGRESCAVNVTESVFGVQGIDADTKKSLAVQVSCN